MAQYVNSQFDENGKTHVAGSWWKDNNDNDVYYCVFNDGTYSIGDYSLFVSSQPTKQEYGRYKDQYEQSGKTGAYTDNGVIYYVGADGEDLYNESYKEDPNYQLAIEANRKAFEELSETQSEMCQKFQNIINMLNTKFNQRRAVYSAYLYFKVGNLVVDTTSLEWNQNILVSFNHKQNGSGQANTFELQIMFKLNERDTSFQINELESALLTVTDITVDGYNNGNTFKNLKNKEDLCGNCIYKYGYGDLDALRTPFYQGNVLKYNSRISNGILTYTITGVGSLYASKEDRLSSKPEYFKLNGIDITNVTNLNTTNSLGVGDVTSDGKTIVSNDMIGPLAPDQIYLSDVQNNSGSEDQTDSGNTIMNPFVFLKNICDMEFKGVYDIKFLLTQEEMDATEDTFDIANFKEFTDKNFFELITDVLNSCTTIDEMEMLKNQKTIAPTQKTLYNYYVSDNSEDGLKGGTIYIYKQKPYNSFSVNSKENEENGNDTQSTNEDGETKDLDISNKVKDIKANLSMAFSWYGWSDSAYNFLVKDWNPKYDGSILLAMAWNLQTKDENGKQMVFKTIDQDGKVVNVQSMGANRIGQDSGSVIQQTLQEFSTWGAVTQYPYEAEMTTIGIPCEVPMCAIIEVIAKIYNNEHHSSGYYYVLGKEDSITSSGYFTTLRLFKIVPTYNPDSSTFEATAGETNPNPSTNNSGASSNSSNSSGSSSTPDAKTDDNPTVYNDINLLARELINAVVDSINYDDVSTNWIKYLSEDEVKALDKYLAETTVKEEEGRSKLDDALESEFAKMFTGRTDFDSLMNNPVFMSTLHEDSQLKRYIENHASDNRFNSNDLYYSWVWSQVDRGLLTKTEADEKIQSYYGN